VFLPRLRRVWTRRALPFFFKRFIFLCVRAIAVGCEIITPTEGYLVVDGQEFNHMIRDENGKVNITSRA
jgi:hypothetical protein